MVVNFKGPEALQALLSARGRVTVVNATGDEDGVRIVAAMLMRHLPDGQALADAAFGLEVDAGMNVPLDPMPSLEQAPAGVEVLLRMQFAASDDVDGSRTEFVDLYLRSEAESTAVNRFEFGLRRHDGEIEDDEILLPDHADFAAWSRALS
jgi:hypothetical protein